MINREATIRWKGYDPDDLSSKSHKRVWDNCDRCGKGRWLSKSDCGGLCKPCGKIVGQSPPEPQFVSEEDRFIPETGIDRIKTIEERGYDPADLSDKSNRKVWCACKECNGGRWVVFNSYRNLCKTCESRRRVKLPKPKFVLEEDRFISETGIDRIITIEKMGYDPIDLKSRSGRKVWCVCKECNKGRWLKVEDYIALCHKCGNNTEEHCNKISNAVKERFQDPDYRASMSGEGASNWQGGISYGKYCEKFNYEFKEKVRNLFNRLCFLCGKDEVENCRKLSVHHVNYDKDCLCNSQCEFVPLCIKCHGKTNYKRRYWEDLIMCHLYPDRITMVDQ